MSCQEFEKQIILFPELTKDEQSKVTAHLKTCEPCSKLFESVTHTNNVLNRAGKINVELADPFRLTNDIMARIKAERHQSWNLLDLSFLKLEFTYVKYTMATLSFLLIVFFGIEQLQSPAILGEVVSKSQSKKVVLNRKTFQEELSKSKTAVNLMLANNCKSPFNITKVNEDCLKQRMSINKAL